MQPSMTRMACALLLAGALAMPAEHASGCACCSVPGQRLDVIEPFEAFAKGELEQVELAPSATLYADEGFPDSVEGIVAPSADPYRVELRLADGVAALSVTDARGHAGTIELAIPAEIARFEVDPRDEAATSPGGGPLLYKEWRLEGTATLTGTFAAPVRRAVARLILHGRGNGCTSAADFTHWTLAVRGPGVRFTLLGQTKGSE